MATLVVLIFFLSGVAALIFETLWFRLAGLSLGNSVWSASLVLAAFMGGLALGNGLAARYGRALKRPIFAYGILELVIGLAGITVVLALPFFPGAIGPVLAGVTDTPWLLNLMRLSIAFIVLLAPATAMGFTLPVLTEALSRIDSSFGASIGKLYGWNTLGAMLGAISAEAFLIEMLGINASGLFALCLNLIAAAVAFRLSRKGEAPLPSGTKAERPRLTPVGARYVLAAFLSGAVMLALEVVWFRFLQLSYPGTGLIFAIMLGIVLGGIALGSIVAGALYRRNDDLHGWLRTSLALSAALVVATYYGYDLFTVQQIENGTTVASFVGFALFLMLPVAILSGAAFTMTARGLKASLGSTVATTGTAALANTVGAMIGSLLGGFVLLPWLGMEKSLCALAAAYIGIALVAPGRVKQHQGRQISLFNGATTAAAIATVFLFPFGLMEQAFFKISERSFPNHRLLETREGLTETVRYYAGDVYGEPQYYRLATNGHSMSATLVEGRRYMKQYVYLPVALRKKMESAALISFGVGSTAKALTDTASLEQIDIIDISKDIIELSSVVFEDDENPTLDPRVTVHIEDGRFFLNTTDRKYDLITSEPPPPKIAGIASLYSQEYFELIREALAPGGYTTYWLPVYQLKPADAFAIMKAFCNAFEDCSLWSGSGLEWMLMGSNGATERATAALFEAQWQDPIVAEELVDLGFELPEQLTASFIADSAQLSALLGETLAVTDNYPLRISSELVNYSERIPEYAALMDIDRRKTLFGESTWVAKHLPQPLTSTTAAFFDYERMINNHFTEGAYRDASDSYLWTEVDSVVDNTTLETLTLWLLGSDPGVQGIVDRQLARGKSRPAFALDLAIRELAGRNFDQALGHVEDYLGQTGSDSPGVRALQLYLLGKQDRSAEARALLATLSQDELKTQAETGFLTWFDERFPSATSPPRLARD